MAEKRKWTDAQEQAMNLRNKLLLVSAAAGSGKTSVLTERIIRTLTQEEDPADLSRMLVVTFTRAATAELKARIAAALAKALAERPGDKHLSRQLFLLGSAQISTIDSFFQQAVRANFEQVGLPASFRLADETEAVALALSVMGDAVRAMYDRYETGAEESDLPFAKLRRNRFAAAMNHLMSNRTDAEFDRKLLDFERKFHAHPEGIALLLRYANEFRMVGSADFFETTAGASLTAYLKDALEGMQKELKPTADYLEADPDSNEKYSGIFSYDLDHCRMILESVEEKSYENARKMVHAYAPAKFPGYRNKPQQILEYKAVRDRLKDLLDDLKSIYFAHSTEEIILQAEKTAELCEMLYELFSEYQTRVWEEKLQRGVLEFDDVRERLYRLLAEPDGTPTPFAESLAAQYDTVYIDEYQDVDRLQDRIFALIGGDRRFMVGDIKQSIYGFRGSEPSIFTEYRNAMPQHDQPEAEHSDAVCVFMSDNFRCNQPVIDFANRVCSFLFSACEESVGYRSKDDLVFSKGRSKELPPPPEVQTVVFEAYPTARHGAEEDEEDIDPERPAREALWVAEEISRLIREETTDNGLPIKPSDIAILVRNASHGNKFAAALEKLGIPVVSAGAQDIFRTPLMTDTLNLLRCIDNPHRDLPLSEYLLSPNGGFSLEELSEIREAAPERKTLFDAMQAMADDPAHSLHVKSQQWISWLEGQRKLASSQPADRFLRLLYLEPRLQEYAASPELLTLYEQARSYQRSSWCGLYGFLEHVEQLMQGKPISAAGFQKADDAVQIMTIHHSKGLEYPVVFVCSCEKRLSDRSLKDNLIFHGKIGCTAKLFDEDSRVNRTTLLREIAKLEVKAEEAEEAIRVLYVALTRARERLYITGTPQGKLSNVLENAATVHRGSRENILYHANYLRWILAALQENRRSESEFPCIFRKISLSDVISQTPLTPVTDTEALPAVVIGLESDAASDYLKILDHAADFSYPLDALRGLPTKVAASKLHEDLLDTLISDQDSTDALNAQIELMSAVAPPFGALLDTKRPPSAAEIGTATHSFLQFCDLNTLSEEGLETEAQRLVEMGFLLPETAAILNREQLAAFCKSNLKALLADAKAIYREQTFGLSVPLAALSKDPVNNPLYQDQTVFVQGSIDLVIEHSDGRLLLVDYKTDRITREELENEATLVKHMTQKHGNQLSCYAGAICQLFGRAPDEVFIYSLPLGRAIPIPTDPQKYLG